VGGYAKLAKAARPDDRRSSECYFRARSGLTSRGLLRGKLGIFAAPACLARATQRRPRSALLWQNAASRGLKTIRKGGFPIVPLVANHCTVFFFFFRGNSFHCSATAHACVPPFRRPCSRPLAYLLGQASGVLKEPKGTVGAGGAGVGLELSRASVIGAGATCPGKKHSPPGGVPKSVATNSLAIVARWGFASPELSNSGIGWGKEKEFGRLVGQLIHFSSLRCRFSGRWGDRRRLAGPGPIPDVLARVAERPVVGLPRFQEKRN